MAVTNKQNARQIWLDIAKGLGICLVVIYHCTEGILNSFQNTESIQYLANFFRSWLMPMFFMVSGILVRRSIMQDDAAKHHSKMLDWAYIYVLWSVIIYLVRLFSNSFTNTQMQLNEILFILWDPVPTIWFIYALLLSYALTYLLRNQSPWRVLPVAFALNIINGVYFGWFEDSIFQQLAWIFCFYSLGFYCADKIVAVVRHNLFSWHWILSFGVLGLLVAVFKPMVPVFLAPFLSIAMSLGFLVICYRTSTSLPANAVKLGAYLGSISLFIYLTHFPLPAASRLLLNYLGLYSYAANMIVATLVAILVAHVAARLAGRVPISWLFKRPAPTKKNTLSHPAKSH